MYTPDCGWFQWLPRHIKCIISLIWNKTACFLIGHNYFPDFKCFEENSSFEWDSEVCVDCLKKRYVGLNVSKIQ